jgi:hypothetical protein
MFNTLNLRGSYSHYFYKSTKTSHAFETSSIYAGKYGIASGSELYFASLKDYSLMECIDYMIDNEVDIINMSNSDNKGSYSGKSAFIDYIIDYYKIPFVISAGNNKTSFSVGSQGLAINAICVASIDANKKISSFSCHEVSDKDLQKPTLSAPGGNISGVGSIIKNLSGTSYSAPFVTGIAARLMEEFPKLYRNPSLLMNALCISSSKIDGQTEDWVKSAGYGIVNYSKAREVLKRTTYLFKSTGMKENEVLYKKAIHLEYEEKIRICAELSYVRDFVEPSINKTDMAPSKIQAILRDENDNIVAKGKANQNISIFEYQNMTRFSEPSNSFVLEIILTENPKVSQITGTVTFGTKEVTTFSCGTFSYKGDELVS